MKSDKQISITWYVVTDYVTAAVAWLLSDEAAFCVGTEMLMDGGYSLA